VLMAATRVARPTATSSLMNDMVDEKARTKCCEAGVDGKKGGRIGKERV
jgi:hypothetical protein